MNPKEASLLVEEGEDVELGCDIVSGASSPSHFYKVSWLYAGRNLSSSIALVQLDHTGLLSYPETPGLGGLQRRLHLSRPAQMSSRLRVQRALEGDSGAYTCQVELFQLDHKGRWQQQASQSSAPITLAVEGPGTKQPLCRAVDPMVVSDITLPKSITTTCLSSGFDHKCSCCSAVDDHFSSRRWNFHPFLSVF